MGGLLLAEEVEGQIFIKGLLTTISIVGGVISILLVFYAFYLFVLMATASDENKRKSAKNRVFKVFSSILIVVSLVAMLAALEVKISGDISGGLDNGSGGGLQEDVLANAKISNLTLNINLENSVFDNKDQEFSILPYSPDDIESATTKKRYYGTARITASNITDAGGTVKAINNFQVVDPTQYFLPKFWTITPSSGSLSIKYELRYGRNINAFNPNLGSANKNMKIAVNIDVDYNGSVTTGWITGYLTCTSGKGVDW